LSLAGRATSARTLYVTPTIKLNQCLETTGITFEIVHGISNNHYKRLDLTETRQILGYHPQYEAYEMLGIMPKAEQ
jgi:hypothetical protein